jgi:hypothetical protein
MRRRSSSVRVRRGVEPPVVVTGVTVDEAVLAETGVTMGAVGTTGGE